MSHRHHNVGTWSSEQSELLVVWSPLYSEQERNILISQHPHSFLAHCVTCKQKSRFLFTFSFSKHKHMYSENIHKVHKHSFAHSSAKHVLSKLLQLLFCSWFCQRISNHLLSGTIFQKYFSSSNSFTYEMLLYINVLALLSVYRVFSKCNSTLGGCLQTLLEMYMYISQYLSVAALGKYIPVLQMLRI